MGEREITVENCRTLICELLNATGRMSAGNGQVLFQRSRYKNFNLRKSAVGQIQLNIGYQLHVHVATCKLRELCMVTVAVDN